MLQQWLHIKEKTYTSAIGAGTHLPLDNMAAILADDNFKYIF